MSKRDDLLMLLASEYIRWGWKTLNHEKHNCKKCQHTTRMRNSIYGYCQHHNDFRLGLIELDNRYHDAEQEIDH